MAYSFIPLISCHEQRKTFKSRNKWLTEIKSEKKDGVAKIRRKTVVEFVWTSSWILAWLEPFLESLLAASPRLDLFYILFYLLLNLIGGEEAMFANNLCSIRVEKNCE